MCPKRQSLSPHPTLTLSPSFHQRSQPASRRTCHRANGSTNGCPCCALPTLRPASLPCFEPALPSVGVDLPAVLPALSFHHTNSTEPHEMKLRSPAGLFPPGLTAQPSTQHETGHIGQPSAHGGSLSLTVSLRSNSRWRWPLNYPCTHLFTCPFAQKHHMGTFVSSLVHDPQPQGRCCNFFFIVLAPV